MRFAHRLHVLLIITAATLATGCGGSNVSGGGTGPGGGGGSGSGDGDPIILGDSSYGLAYYGKTHPAGSDQWVCMEESGGSVSRQSCNSAAGPTAFPTINEIGDNSRWDIDAAYMSSGDIKSVRAKDTTFYWYVVFDNGEYRLQLDDRGVENYEFPVAAKSYQFRFVKLADGTFGEERYAIESMLAPGHYLSRLGHSLAAKGAKFMPYASAASAPVWHRVAPQF